MEIGYHNRRPRADQPYAYYPTLMGLAHWADILMVSGRADATNFHAVNKEVLAALGPRGHLVNISRGIAVDEAALCDALEAGVIAGAALDVFEHEPTIPHRLKALDNVVLTPHMAAISAEDATYRGDDETKGEFCNRRRVGVAGVRDDDPSRPSGRTIDALVACAIAGDEPQLWQSVHQRRVGANAAHRDERARLARRGWDRVRLRSLQPMQRVAFAQPTQEAREKSGGDEDGGFHCEPSARPAGAALQHGSAGRSSRMTHLAILGMR